MMEASGEDSQRQTIEARTLAGAGAVRIEGRTGPATPRSGEELRFSVEVR